MQKELWLEEILLLDIADLGDCVKNKGLEKHKCPTV